MNNKAIIYCIVIFFIALVVNCSKNKQTQPPKIENASVLMSDDEKEKSGQIHVAHILVMHMNSQRKPNNITRTKEDAKVQAESLLQKLKDGSDFGQLAGLYSDCPSKKMGGDLGYIRKGDMAKEFENAAFALQKGQLSNVIETPFGYHIIKRF
jgi:parvulin-like peptidyl-prolyl isomerase